MVSAAASEAAVGAVPWKVVMHLEVTEGVAGTWIVELDRGSDREEVKA